MNKNIPKIIVVVLLYISIVGCVTASTSTSSHAQQEINKYVTLSNFQINAKITRKGSKATINFQSEQSLTNENLWACFHQESNFTCNVYSYSPEVNSSMTVDGFPNNFSNFIMSTDKKGEIRFIIYHPGLNRLPNDLFYGVTGKRKLSISFAKCIDDKCSHFVDISNVLEREVDLEY